MTLTPIEPTQQTAARVAGVLYVTTMVMQMLAELYLRLPLLVAGDPAQTAANIVASERLFRMSIVGVLLGVAGRIALAVALYVVLTPIGRHVAFLGAFFRLAECAVFAVIAFNDFLVLRLLSGAEYLRAFETEQLQALARMFLSVRHEGGQIGSVFLGLGSIVFAYLWFKSRYIPRPVAVWGILAALVLLIALLGDMLFPGFASAMGPAYWAPMFLFEVVLGFWLLIKGLRAPEI